MRKNEQTTNKVVKNYRWIEVALLHSKLECQRTINESRVRYIIDNFDENEVEPPCVSYRDGKYNVIDGQHTISAVRELGWTKIKCEIRTGLNEEDENAWFVMKNTKNKPQTKNSILNARLNSGVDTELIDLVAYLGSVGYKLKTVGIKVTNGVINATDTIEKIFKDMGKQDFIKYITLHNSTWNGDKDSLKASHLKGLEKFYNTYKNEFDDKRFIKVFNKDINPKAKTVSAIVSEADADVYTKDVALRYAKVFVKYYNLNYATSKKLKPSKLED